MLNFQDTFKTIIYHCFFSLHDCNFNDKKEWIMSTHVDESMPEEKIDVSKMIKKFLK